MASMATRCHFSVLWGASRALEPGDDTFGEQGNDAGDAQLAGLLDDRIR